MSEVDYEGLERLLGALAEGVASRVQLDEAAVPELSSIPETLPDAWRDTAPGVQVDTLPRGVPLRTVARAVLGHFLPAVVLVTAPLALLTFIVNPLEYDLNLRVLSLLFLTTLGFAVGLGALSPLLYPHSNPDGKRSEVAGFVSPLVWLIFGFVLDRWPLPEIPASNFLAELAATGVLALTPGIALAVLAFAPWLQRTSRIAPVSPPGRWKKLRAIVVTGGLSAVMFGSAKVIGTLLHPTTTGAALWPGLVFNLAFGASFGFLVGVAFAMVLALVYRRYAVEELRAWKVGLWAAAAATLPHIVIVMQVVPAQRGLLLTLGSLVQAFVVWNLPAFLMGYAAVKLAQRSGPTG